MPEQQQHSEEEPTERTVMVNGIEHTMMLTDEDAKRYELAEENRPKAEESSSSKAKAPANKARQGESK